MTKQSIAERIEFNNCLDNIAWAMEHEAPSSNRGSMKCKPRLKTLREVKFYEGYQSSDFKFLSKGFDSLQEAFNVRLKEHIERLIVSKKKEAEGVGHEVSLGLSLSFFGDFQVFSRGTKGIKYILKNDKIEIFISSFTADWGVSVRYLSFGLFASFYDSSYSFNRLSQWLYCVIAVVQVPVRVMKLLRMLSCQL